MPVYELIKNGEVVNTIVADEVESIRNQYDSIKEVVPKPPVVAVPTIDANRVRQNLSISERVKWDNNSTANIVTAKIEFTNPRLVPEATEIINFLVAEGDISQESADKILAV